MVEKKKKRIVRSVVFVLQKLNRVGKNDVWFFFLRNKRCLIVDIHVFFLLVINLFSCSNDLKLQLENILECVSPRLDLVNGRVIF